jgi:integrase
MSTSTDGGWAQAWDAFLRDGKSAATRESYRSLAVKIDRFRAEKGIGHPDEFTDEREGEFLEQFEVTTTRWTYQKVLRAFFRWGERNGWRHGLPTAKRITLTELDEPLDFVGKDELEAALKVASPRDRALLIFTFYTGARASEVRNAKLADWHRRDHTMLLEQTKTGRRREIPLPESAAREINRYIDRVRPATRQPWMFVTRRKDGDDYTQLTRSGMASVYRRLRQELDIATGQFSAQLLRRGRATEWAKATRDTHHLMRLGGWRDPRSLRRYLYQSLEQDKALIEQIERQRDE